MAVNVEGESAYVVAYRLMEKIASTETASKVPAKVENPREYYLTLYSQCLDAQRIND